MNTIFLTIIGSISLLIGSQALGQGKKPETPPGQEGAPGVSLPDPAVKLSRAVVRGWEVQSAMAIKRRTVRDVFPVFEERKPAGSRVSDRASLKGEFVIVQVRCTWATKQPPNEPLWVGKPDAVLVDESGVEYPAGGFLFRNGSDYVTPNMVLPELKEPAKRPDKNLVVLLYFDAPRGLNYRLKVGEGVPLLDLRNVTDLPVDSLTEVLD